MEFLSNKPLLITDTILRDAHQSQAATRMTIEDMIPALEPETGACTNGVTRVDATLKQDENDSTLFVMVDAQGNPITNQGGNYDDLPF